MTAPIARAIAATSFGPPETRSFAIRYWDGFEERGADATSPFTLVIHHPEAVRAMFLPPSELAFTTAYLRGDVDVEGDIEAAVAAGRAAAERLSSPRRLGRVMRLALRLPGDRALDALLTRGLLARGRRSRGRQHSRKRDAASIRYHYDAGNDFYRLWLDRQMVYSCGYFPPDVSDLDTAQTAKLDYVCRKLRLQPGERLLDIGCGWGALIRHATRCYGVESLGITLSPAQAEIATRRAADEGLAERCRVEVRDYRDLPSHVLFDKVASVGMVEHVGRANLPTYFAAVGRSLRPGGLFLNHGIVDLETQRHHGMRARWRRRLWREGRFIQRYVFPDGDIVPLAGVVRAAEATGFESRDLESLREHYVLTLRHWLQRLESHGAEAIALVGNTTFRVWRLYLAASAHAFAAGRIGVVQLLLSKAGAAAGKALPLTRHDLYSPVRQ